MKLIVNQAYADGLVEAFEAFHKSDAKVAVLMGCEMSPSQIIIYYT